MLTDFSIEDNLGFIVTYTGSETLNGVNTYIEFDYYSEETGIHKVANTRGKTISQNNTVTAGGKGQYKNYPYHIKARIVDNNKPWRNSDWLQLDFE